MSTLRDERLLKGWQKTRLADVASLQLGKMLDRKRRHGVQRPYLRNANVQWGRIDTSDLLSMPFEAPHELEKFAVRAGDVLICEGGEPGRAAVWRGTETEIKFQKALHRVRLPNGIEPGWLVHQLYRDVTSGRLASRYTGTTIRHLPREALAEYEIVVAPSAEQRRIIASLDSHLSRLDEVEAALERVQRNLKRYRAAVLQAAVEGRLVPTEAELARAEGRQYETAGALLARLTHASNSTPNNDVIGSFPLPDGWSWSSVGQLLQAPLANGRSVPDAETGFPVLRLTALRGDAVDLTERKMGRWSAEEASAFRVRKGDFFVSRGSGSKSLVGRGALVVSEPDPVAFPDTLIRVRVSTKCMHPRLLVLLWNSQAIRRHIERRAKTTAGIYKINQSDLASTPIPIPPRVEQDRLVEALDRHLSVADGAMRSFEVQKARCARVRQSILKWAFEGRLVDQDPSDEPASVLLERIRAERATAEKARPRRKRASPRA